MYLLDLKTNSLVEAEIIEAESKDMPLKKDGWNFTWKSLFRNQPSNSKIYVLRIKSNPESIQGVLKLKIQDGMLIMDLVEIAPHNIGRNNKRYDYVAGCLIAFSCRESFKLKSDYKGFLAFESKTKLIDWYMKKYYAQVAMGQKMFIESLDGQRLVKEYFNRKK